MRVTNVPALIEAEIVGTIEHWHDLVAAAMTAEAGRRIIQSDIFRRLLAGTIETAWVIAAADAGHQGADLALRTFAATFIDQGREPELSAQVRAIRPR
jgi:hypothetical protein